jgi:flagellum-specific ATP synthase
MHDIPFVLASGRTSSVSAQAVHVNGLSRFLHIGSLVTIGSQGGPVLGEVIRMDETSAIVKPLNGEAGISLGAPVSPVSDLTLWPHESWKGRLVDALGRPADRGPALVKGEAEISIRQRPPEAMSRRAVATRVATGVKVIDVFTPLCIGQRLGIFAGSGIGKSTLLSMLARSAGFQTLIVALVGERGREVRDFIEGTLGELAKTAITVVSTGDESSMMRRLAPRTAMAIAEYFCGRGDEVLLIVDSVTRYAHACRDVALAAGEPPVARGYPPSVFSDLPQLLERAGPGAEGKGSITGIFSVLVDGDDHNDPVADAIRGTLDGHIVLDRAIAESGRYPAVDILASISRLSNRAWTNDQRSAVIQLRKLVARYEDSRDLVAVGGYQAGADEELDRAMAIVPKLYGALNQSLDQPPSRDAFRDIAEVLSK